MKRTFLAAALAVLVTLATGTVFAEQPISGFTKAQKISGADQRMVSDTQQGLISGGFAQVTVTSLADSGGSGSCCLLAGNVVQIMSGLRSDSVQTARLATHPAIVNLSASSADSGGSGGQSLLAGKFSSMHAKSAAPAAGFIEKG